MASAMASGVWFQAIPATLRVQAAAEAPKELQNFIYPLFCISVKGGERAYCFLTGNLVTFIVKALELQQFKDWPHSGFLLLRKEGRIVLKTIIAIPLHRSFATTLQCVLQIQKKMVRSSWNALSTNFILLIFITILLIVSSELFETRGLQNVHCK